LFVLPSEAEFVRELESHNLLLAELTIEHVLQKLFRNSDWMARRPHTMEEAATSLQVKKLEFPKKCRGGWSGANKLDIYFLERQ
jgi:hypothetical protein